MWSVAVLVMLPYLGLALAGRGAGSLFSLRRAGGGFLCARARTMVTSEPCAVVVTSGTAVAELLPAVIEAFLSAADR